MVRHTRSHVLEVLVSVDWNWLTGAHMHYLGVLTMWLQRRTVRWLRCIFTKNGLRRMMRQEKNRRHYMPFRGHQTTLAAPPVYWASAACRPYLYD